MDMRDTLNQIAKGPIQVEDLQTSRRVIEVAHIQPVRRRKDVYVVSSKPVPLRVLKHTMGNLRAGDVLGWWKDVELSFIGVHPEIMGAEPIRTGNVRHYRSSFVRNPDIHAFVRGLDDIANCYANVIWSPVYFPTYRPTGRVYNGYYEQEKIRPIKGPTNVKLRTRSRRPVLNLSSRSVNRVSATTFYHDKEGEEVWVSETKLKPGEINATRQYGEYVVGRGISNSLGKWYRLQCTESLISALYDAMVIWSVT